MQKSTMASLSRRSLVAVACTSVAPLAWARADNFPNKPVKRVVNFPAGGYADNIARMFSARFSEVLKTQVIVANRGGAGGTIGADFVAKAPAEGYTRLLTPFAVFTHKNPELKLANAMDDFVPGAPLVAITWVVASSTGSHLASLADCPPSPTCPGWTPHLRRSRRRWWTTPVSGKRRRPKCALANEPWQMNPGK